MFRARIERIYRAAGLLVCLTVAALVIGATLHHTSGLPSRYTWLEPLRTLRLVFEVEYFPTAILATYLVATLRREPEGFARRTWGRLRDGIEAGALGVSARSLLLAAPLSVIDAILFASHNALDVASIFVLVLVAGHQRLDRRRWLELLGHTLLAATAFSAICYCYTVVKALTFSGRMQVDPVLAGFERAIFGDFPHRVIASWASGRHAFVSLCDWVYFRFFHHMVLTTALLMGMRQPKERTEYLGALALCYLIGAPLYHLLPSVGPGYHEPEYYKYLGTMPLTTNDVRSWLYANTMDVVQGKAEVLQTWGYIACMPSLHIAQELVMLYYARKSNIALAFSSVFTAITAIAVVVLGWHYVIDSVGAVLVAGTAIAVARWQRDRLMPAVLAPRENASLPVRSSFGALASPDASGHKGASPEGSNHPELPDDRGEPPAERSASASSDAPATHPQPAVDTGRILLALAATGLVVRLFIALRDQASVDRLFIPDDAYYTLSIARSLADGHGATADGVTLTNGFQPLLAFLTAPSFWFGGGHRIPIATVLVLSAIADALSVWLLGRIAERSGGALAGVVAAGAWAVSPVAIANALNGLETALALALELALVECWCRVDEHGGTRRSAVAGALAGLALLARVDSAFLVASLGVLALIRLRRRPIDLLAMVGTAVAVVAPWWIYCLSRFGTVVPESGLAVRAIVALHEAMYLTTSKTIAWTGGSLIGPPLGELSGLRTFLFEHPDVGMGVGIVVAAGLVVAIWMLLRRHAVSRASTLAFATHAVCLVAFYSLWLPALWFFRRYLSPTHALITLLVAIGVGRLFGRSPKLRLETLLVGTALLFAAAAAVTVDGRFARGLPAGNEYDSGLNGAKGYAAAAQDVLALVPDGAVVGAFQSGALSYFRSDKVRVVNLDGVVDGQARQAAQAGTLLDYAYRRHVTHIADWQFNIDNLRRLSERTRQDVDARVIGAAKPQGPDRFIVFALDWQVPPPPPTR